MSMEENKEPLKKKKSEKPEESSDYEFIKERIKDRPINKKKLIKRLLFTAGMAVLFSLIACLSFLLLEPRLEEFLYPEEEMDLNLVILPEAPEEAEEPITIETPIEDMSLTDEDIDGNEGLNSGNNPNPPDIPNEENVSGNTVTGQEGGEEPSVIIQQVEIGLDDYQLLYRKLYALSSEVSKSLVTVTGITSDVDWMNETYLSTNQTTGLIIADNGYELLILAGQKNLEDAERIRITFIDGATADASFKHADSATGLAVYAVPLSDIKNDTKESIMIAVLGSSYSSTLLGNAVIAIGNPLGSGNSVCYGAITSVERTVSLLDGNYQLLTTDIYGSRNANGVLINIRGQVVGFITQDYNSQDMQNLIYAYGISSIRQLVQNLSNDIERTQIGLYLSEIPVEAMEEMGMPGGVYVTNVAMNTPAMNYGISKGDVITAIGERQITSVSDYMQAIAELQPGDTVMVRYARLSNGVYKSMEVTLELDDGV